MATATPLPKGPSNSLVPAGKERQPVTVPDFLAAKARGVRLTMLTAYDYTMARLLDAAGVDGLLVGDSLGMVVQGHEHSLGVTLDEVIYHTRCVARGVRHALLVADMPFMSFQVSPQQALKTRAGWSRKAVPMPSSWRAESAALRPSPRLRPPTFPSW